MRTLPAALQTAIAQPGQQPVLQVTIQDLINRYTQLATGGPAGRCAALLTTAGTLLKAVVGQSADPNPITVQRITNPATSSQWSAAGTVITANAQAAAGCALAQTGGTIRCFYQSNADHKIYFRDSTDDGQTFSAETATNGSLFSVFPYCYGLAADSITQVWAAYANYDPNGSCVLLRSAFSGSWSAWSNEGPATPAWGRMRGLQCFNQSGTRRFAVGVQTAAGISGIAAGIFTWNGSAYSAIATVQPMDAPNLGLSVAYPNCTFDGQRYWYAALIQDDGSLSGVAQSRLTVFTSIDFVSWSPYASLGDVFRFGAWAFNLGGTLYLFDGQSVYTAPVGPPATDVSADVLSLYIKEDIDRPAELTLRLSNLAGTYLNHPSIRTDARISVALGYEGITVPTHSFIVDSYSYASSAEDSSLTITARDHAKLLDYPSSRLLSYTGQTVGTLAQAIAAQAGCTLAPLPTTPQFAQTIPCFVIVPGETWLQAELRLGDIYGFDFFADPTPQLRLKETLRSDPVVWSYGGDLIAASYAQSADQANIIRVLGIQPSTSATIFAEAIDGLNLATVGKERWRQHVERLLDTAAKCQIKAAILLKEEQQAATGGELLVAMHPGIERLDVIAVTNAALGLTNLPVRVTALQLHIEPGAMTWTHHMALGGV